MSKIALGVGCGVAFAVWLSAPPAAADDETSQATARTYFKRGLNLVERGELVEAVGAFEDAHRTSPRYEVLYNLGLAYAAIGRSQDAVRTLESYLSEGGQQVAPRRRKEVSESIQQQRARLGRIELELSPNGAELIVDGISLGTGPFEPLELTSGKHVFAARSERHQPHAVAIDVRSGTTERVSLRLLADASPPQLTIGQVFVPCKVPGVRVSVDANVVGVTPLTAPLVLPAGQLAIGFDRDGYRPVSTRVRLENAAVRNVECNLVPDAVAPLRTIGSLQVRASEPDARILLDGQPYQGEQVPFGPHTLLVQKEGYLPHQETVLVAGGHRRALLVLLEPTPATRKLLETTRKRRLTWAAGLGLGGVALGGTAAITYAWNMGRYRDWQDDVTAYEAALAQGGGGADVVAQGGALRERATGIQRADDLALAMALAATSMAVSAGILWFTASD